MVACKGVGMMGEGEKGGEAVHSQVLETGDGDEICEIEEDVVVGMDLDAHHGLVPLLGDHAR